MATTSLSPIRGSNGHQQQIPIDPSQPLELSVSNASGEIRLHASDQQNVWVVVRRTDGQVDEEGEVGIAVDVEGNRISVHPDWQIMSGLSGLARRIRDQLKDGFNPDDWNLSKLKLNPNLEYDIRVEVPRQLAAGSRISLKTASGSVETTGTRADLSVATASGSVRLEDLDGRIAAHTASGSVKARAITGSLEVNTASGSIQVEEGEAWTALRSMSGSVRLDRFVLKNARITTVSGSVRGDVTISNTSDYDIETVSGSVNLNATLPGDGGASLSFRSLSGSAHVDGDWVPGSGKRTWRLPAGTTGPAIRVKTVSGSLHMTGRADAAVSLRNEPLPAEPHREWADTETTDTAPMGDFEADIERTVEKAVGWVREATRRVHEATQQHTDQATRRVHEATQEHAGHMRHTSPGDTEPMPPSPPTPPTAAPPTPPTPPAAPPTPPTPHAARAEHIAEPSAPPSASPPMEPTDTVPFTDRDRVETADEKRLRLLQAVERGEIDIEEALAQMEGDAPDEDRRA